MEAKSVEYIVPTLEELLNAGVHFGHQKRRWNPRILPYIFEHKGKVHIFDLVKTKEMLNRACNFLYEIGRSSGAVIFVGTKRQSVNIVSEAATSCGAFYVNKRWLGGTITNFDSIKKKIDRLIRIEKGLKEGGEYASYTKKERLDLSRDMEKLEAGVGGLRGLKGIPQALFVIDIKRESTAVAEAKRMNIPVVAIVDSNCSPTLVDLPIPGNDDSTRSIEILTKTVAEALKDGYSKKYAEESDVKGEAQEEKELDVLKVKAVKKATSKKDKVATKKKEAKK